MSLRASVADARHLSRILLLAAIYLILAYVALIEGDLGKIVWPASGFALAFLLLYGVEHWPGVALGAFLASQTTSDNVLYAFTTAVGNSLEVVFAALLLRHAWGFDARMGRARDVVAMVCGGAAGACASALLGILGMHLAALAPLDALPRIAWKWTLGHAMGVTAVTPFVLTVDSWWKDWKERRQPWSCLEAAALFLLLLLVCAVAFWGGAGLFREYDLEYLPFPLLVWAAFRFGVPGAASANLLTSGMAVAGTVAGWAPFASGSSSEDLLLTWSFVNASAVTTLLLAAVVSEGRRAEEERHKSDRRFRTLIEQAADGIFSSDGEGRLTDANSRGCDMLGLDRDAVLGLELSGLVESRDRDRVRSLVRDLTPGEAVISSWHVQRAGGGAAFPAEVSIKRLDDGRLQAFVRDVTERLALEEQLSQSQKMEAVGVLAGGIAHDFNNLLTAIIGHSDFALMRLPRDSKVKTDIEEVSKAAGRAADLTRKLLAFARKQLVEPKLLSMLDLAQNLENMLKRVLGEHIELTIQSEGEPWKVKVDPVQLEQVILNIAINARDAMPHGGRLEIECRNVYWSGDGTHDASPGAYATLALKDTGVGMDPETLPRIFEPFYTTKDRSQGTGLGLAVSYGIVKQAGGYIWATSVPGQGSTFRILLPRAEDSEAPEAARVGECATVPKTEAAVASGGETILLIEDEPMVRDLALEVLSSRSYRVLTAKDGEEALSIARAHPEEIHLTVTDVVLPAMSGKEVARRLRETRPDLRVLFMSGYAEEQVVHRGVVENDVAFLAKPFTPTALSEKVRLVLAERNRSIVRHSEQAAQDL
jgi:PAS domain S-box-containing protein